MTEGIQQRGRRTGFWVSAAIGWVIIAVGVRGIFEKTIDTRPAQLARFVIGGALLHDLVVAPLAIVAGVVVVRAVKGRAARPPVQAALIVTAIVVLFAYPLVRAYGLAANNPTSLPHNYAANLVVVLAVVWAAAGVAIAVRRRRSRTVVAKKVRPTRA